MVEVWGGVVAGGVEEGCMGLWGRGDVRVWGEGRCGRWEGRLWWWVGRRRWRGWAQEGREERKEVCSGVLVVTGGRWS